MPKKITKSMKILFSIRRLFTHLLYDLDAFKTMPDELYLKYLYFISRGKKLNLENPKDFTSKIQWMKLFYKNPLYTKLADKYAVREYIAEKIGEKYLIPLLWVGERFDDIHFDELPNQFVIKCNHDSGSAVICKDKESFDVQKAREKIEKRLRIVYGKHRRQLHYYDILRKVLVEEYLSCASGEEISDYKIFCFNGEPKVIAVYSDRFGAGGRRDTFFDTHWNILDLSVKHPRHITPPKKPENLKELLILSEVLSKGIPFVRVDFYIVDGKIYFGELTFTPAGGFYRLNPPEWDDIWGDWLELPQKHTM